MKYIGGQIKSLIFPFCTDCHAKSTKGASVNIQSDSETTCKKKTGSSSVFTRSGKVRKAGDRSCTEWLRNSE